MKGIIDQDTGLKNMFKAKKKHQKGTGERTPYCLPHSPPHEPKKGRKMTAESKKEAQASQFQLCPGFSSWENQSARMTSSHSHQRCKLLIST